MKNSLAFIILGLSLSAQAQMFEIRKSYDINFPSIAEREVKIKSYLDEIHDLFKLNTRASITKACKFLGAINYDFNHFKDVISPLNAPEESVVQIDKNLNELFFKCAVDTTTLSSSFNPDISSIKKSITSLLNPYRDHDEFNKKFTQSRSSYILDGLINIVSSLNYPSRDHEKNKNSFCFTSGFYTAFYIDSRSVIREAFSTEINNSIAKSSDKFFSTYCQGEKVDSKDLSSYAENLQSLIRQLTFLGQEWLYEDW